MHSKNSSIRLWNRLNLHKVQFGHVTNDIMRDQQKHYVTIFMCGECIDHTLPKNLEPHKCHGWDSYSWEELVHFASKSGVAKDSSNDSGMENKTPMLFGPLLKLVEEAPQTVLDFQNK